MLRNETKDKIGEREKEEKREERRGEREEEAVITRSSVLMFDDFFDAADIVDSGNGVGVEDVEADIGVEFNPHRLSIPIVPSVCFPTRLEALHHVVFAMRTTTIKPTSNGGKGGRGRDKTEDKETVGVI